MIDTELLRQKLIDMAMRGQLVEQRPEDGNATDLLNQIRAEKAALIKSGKIKKEKPLPEIEEDEKPFAIPANWCWVRLGEIVSKDIKRGKSPIYADNGTTLVFAQKCNTKSGNIDLSLAKYLEPASLSKYPLEEFLRNGDIVINSTGRGTIGRVGFIKDIDIRLSIVPDSHVTVVRAGNSVFSKYLFYCLVVQQTFFECAGDGSTNQIELKTSVVQNVLVPLPPLAEQKRIVGALEANLKLIDTIAKDSADLDKALKFLRQKLLDMAMRGQLVEQRPEDGNATDLLNQIRVEKAALIKSGKIKKEKPLPEIKEEEKPFAIPANWRWVRLGEILNLLVDGTHKTPNYIQSGVPFVSVKNISSGKLDFLDTKFISLEEHEELSQRCNPKRGDILLSKVGTTGVPAKVDTDIAFSIFVSVALLKFSHHLLNIDYLIASILSTYAQKQCKRDTRGVTNKNWVLCNIARTVIPLPPTSEQKRIANKLEQINALIDTMLN